MRYENLRKAVRAEYEHIANKHANDILAVTTGGAIKKSINSAEWWATGCMRTKYKNGKISLEYYLARAEKYDVRAKRFNNLVKSFERCMCRNDTNRYAFFHVPVHYLKYPGMWDIRESFTDTRYMAGFKEWTLDGLKEEGETA